MSLTPRQMLILLVMIVGFGVAAYVVSRDSDSLPEIDTAAWCSGAEGLTGFGPVFRGDVDDASVEELDAIKEALFDIENAAPYELRPGIAPLADFLIIAKQARGDLDWSAAFASARADVDVAVVDQALADLDTEMSLCGLDLG